MKYRLRYLIVYLGVIFLLPGLLSALMNEAARRMEITIDAVTRGTIINFGIYVFMGLLALKLFHGPLKKEWKKCTFGSLLGAVGCGFLLLLFELGVSMSVRQILHQSGTTSNQAALNSYFGKAPALIAFSSIVLAPLVEEIVYRWVIMGGIKEKLGEGIGLVVSSLAFAYAHTGRVDTYSILVYGALGAGLGFFYIKRDNIIENMIIHATHNGFVVALMYYSQFKG